MISFKTFIFLLVFTIRFKQCSIFLRAKVVDWCGLSFWVAELGGTGANYFNT